MNTRERVEYVLALRAKGYICLPVLPGRRRLAFPAMDRKPWHFQTRRKNLMALGHASTAYGLAQQPPTPETLERWFGNHDGNIGNFGGYEDLCILDFDDSEQFERLRQQNRELLAATPIARTPNGYHVYLKRRYDGLLGRGTFEPD